MPTLPNISPELIKTYQDEISKSSSPATARRKSISLNKFFNWAESSGKIDQNPLHIDKPEVPEPTKSRKRYIGVKTWATLGGTAAIVILIFLFLGKIKLPISFKVNLAQESDIQTVTGQNTSDGTSPLGTNPANRAVIAGWKLYAKLKLTDAEGQPQTGSQTISFKIFDQDMGGALLYTSDPKSVTSDSDGTVLISLDTVPTDLFFQNNRLYLEPQVNSKTVSSRIPISTANVAANLGGFFPADPDGGAEAYSIPVIDGTGALVIASQTPSIKGTDGTLLVEGQAVTIKAADGSSGDIEINPDAGGIAHFLFEGNKGKFLNAQAPNLSSGSLYYGMVPNNATGYYLANLQSGSPTLITRFSVDALGNTYASGNLNVAGNIATGGTTRLTSGGALTSINGYSQDSGDFTITQGSDDAATITRTGTAINDVLELTLNETGQNASSYSTLTLNRTGGNISSSALYVDSGSAIFDEQVMLGRFSSNPASIGEGSIIYNSTDDSVYYWDGSSWVQVATGGSSFSGAFTDITSGTNTIAAMVVGSGASLDYTGTGTINASSLIGATWTAPGAIGSVTPNSGAFTTLSSTGITTLGNGSATVAIDSSDWDINTAGDMTGIGGIAADGTIAFTGTTIGLGTSNSATTVNIGTGTGGNTFNIGTDNTLKDTINIGSALDDVIINGAGAGSLINFANFDVEADGDIVTAGDLAVNGGDITTTATTFNLLAGATTLLNIGPAGNVGSITLAGGSGATGCTLDGTNGDFTCSGTISGTIGGAVSFASITSGTNTGAAMVVGTGASLDYENAGTINASSLIGGTWAAPGTIGSGTPNSGAFTTLSATGDVTMNDASSDTILIGQSGATDDVVTIAGNVSLTDDNWSITDAGVASFITGSTIGSLTFTTNNIADSGSLTIKSATTNALTLDSGTTGTVNLGTGTSGKIINIGTDNTNKDTINIGSALDDVIINGAGAGSLINFANFDVDAAGNVTVAAGQGIDTNGAGELRLGYTNATSVSIGTTAATTINIGLAGNGASNIVMAGGSGDTGCTLDGSNGNLICSGNITSTATSGTQGWWTRTAGNLSPTNLNDTISATTSASVALTLTQAGAFNALLVEDEASDTTPFVVDQDGNVGIGKTTPLFKLDVAGNASISGTLSLGPMIQADAGTCDASSAGKQYYDGPENKFYYCNGTIWTAIGSGGGGAWNDLTSPDGTLTLDMLTHPTTFNWDTGTGASDLFSFTTDASSDGTGYLLNLATGTSSTVKPLHVSAGAVEALAVDASGNVGVGTTSPTAKLDVAGDASTSGTLTFRGTTDPSINILNGENLDFKTSVGGDTGLTATMQMTNAGNFSALGSLQIGAATNSVAYSRFGTAATSHVGTVTAANDLLITGDLELNGNLYLDNNTISNSAGTAMITLSSDITTTLSQLAGSWLVDNQLNVGMAALMVNQASTINDIFVASQGGTTNFVIANNGDVAVGPGGTGKITVGTVDPPYTINGNKYATYLTSMAGVKEEVAGNIQTNEYVPGVGYRNVIDFNNLPEGSDLWIFSKATDIKTNIGQLVALLTPSEPTKVWYEVDRQNHKLAIYSAKPAEISYRLTGPRFDYADHPNQRADSAEGFVLNIPDIINTNPIATTIRYLSGYVVEKIVDGVYTVKDSDGVIIDGIESIGNFVAANIKSGAIQTQEMATDSFTAFRGTVDNLLVSSGLVAGNIQTKLISPVADSTDVTVRIGSEATPSGKLAIQDSTGTEVASIDNEGNASFEGTVSSEQLAVGGQATVSGTLFADEIKSKSLDDINELLSRVKSDQDLMMEASGWDTLTSTDSANLSSLVTTDLYVTNQGAFNALSVSNSLTVGSDLLFLSTLNDDQLTINSIDTLSSPLRIQSLAMAPVEIMAGLVTIDTQGNVRIAGNLNVAGRIESAGLTLKDNEQSGADNQQSLLSLQDSVGNTVSAVDASGGASFNSLSTQGLTIAAGPDASVSGTIVDGVITTNSTVGKAIIPAGTAEITISNPKVTDYTLVYVTPTSTTQNYVLYVKSKEAGKFVVGFDNTLPVNVAFNWWIVQVSQ